MIDLLVARAVMAARQIERAVHDPGPWTMVVDDVAYPASRWVGDDFVLFRSHLPEVCYLGEDNLRLVELRCRDDLIGERQVEFDDGDTILDWKFSIPVMERARA